MYTIRRHRKPYAINFIILLNAIVFICWAFQLQTTEFMRNNFLVSWTALEAGRYWVLITPAFSHNMFLHFLINMMVLKSFGGFMEVFMGRRKIFFFYLIAGVVGNLAHALTSRFLVGNADMPALGASGAVAGIILLFSLLFPREKILLFGILPMPAIFGALAFVGIDLWGLYSQAQGGGFPIGHGAHLGGSLAGVIYFIWIKQKYNRLLENRRGY
jgi:membrane associated rhomboid family serine protease